MTKNIIYERVQTIGLLNPAGISYLIGSFSMFIGPLRKKPAGVARSRRYAIGRGAKSFTKAAKTPASVIRSISADYKTPPTANTGSAKKANERDGILH